MNTPIGQLLIKNNLITEAELEESLELQRQEPNKRLGDILIEKGYVNELDFFKILAKRLNLSFTKISDYKVSMDAISLVDLDYAKENEFFPLDFVDEGLLVATTEPNNYFLLDEIKQNTGYNIVPILTTRSEIEAAIKTYYNRGAYSEVAKSINDKFGDIIETDINEQMEEEIQDTPIVKIVNEIIDYAFNVNASDIHIEPRKEDINIRLRVDGKLIEYMKINYKVHQNLVTRIKILGNMDITEKRIPLDGRFSITYQGRDVDIRISSIPTVLGEKIVMRILGGTGDILKINQLGFTKQNEALFNKIINSTYGLIIICGPTGSGKTTTLYSMLDEISLEDSNTITVEDPVEYKIDGINQIQVNNKAGLTFAEGLRGILRQDPDIIMIGEIRDSETASIAVRSSITGHRVLSTIHTNDAIGVIARLADMGVEEYLISSSLVGVIAQRLVRKLCSLCKKPVTTSEDEMQILNITQPVVVYTQVGCTECNLTGYKGRLPIHEILIVTKEVRKLINIKAHADEIKKVAESEGFVTLKDTCARHVLNGDVSLDELIRATYVLE